jgi:hypothetical protein
MNTFYTYPACVRVVSNASHASATEPPGNLRHEAAQEVQGRFGQERKPYPLMRYIERDPLVKRAALYPTLQFSDPSFGLDCSDDAREPWTGQPEGSGKRGQPLQRRTDDHPRAAEPAPVRYPQDQGRVKSPFPHLPQDGKGIGKI